LTGYFWGQSSNISAQTFSLPRDGFPIFLIPRKIFSRLLALDRVTCRNERHVGLSKATSGHGLGVPRIGLILLLLLHPHQTKLRTHLRHRQLVGSLLLLPVTQGGACATQGCRKAP